MRQRGALRQGTFICAMAIVLIALVGCGSQGTVDVPGEAAGYRGALDTSYEGALDPTVQLGLGTLKLEGTAEAVTGEQAGDLLPLWQLLQGSELQGTAERSAVMRQIEATMTAAQLAAIRDMRLMATDLRVWSQERGLGADPGGQGRAGRQPQQGGAGGQQMPGGAPPNMSEEQIAQMRERFQNMSPEERATMRAQFSPQQDSGAGTAAGPIAALIDLLAERSGAGAARAPLSTRAPAPTSTVAPTETPTPVDEPTETPVPAPSLMPTDTATAVPSATPAAIPSPTPAAELQSPVATVFVLPAPALRQLEDKDPGPPFTVEVSANRATQDPLVEKSRHYTITGLVRNDGDQTYALSALHVTFFDAQGFRGSYYRFPGPGRMGGEWIWHGRTEADVACLLLAPGQVCPFRVEITAQDMASFVLHPDAAPTERESAAVELSDLTLSDAGLDFVRIRGTATNCSPFKVKNLTVSGALIDAHDQIVSVGSSYVLRQDIAPGESLEFDLRVEKEPFETYRLYAQAERDWE